MKNERIVVVRERGVEEQARAQGPHWLGCQSYPRPAYYPLIRRNGKLEEATWDKAMDLIVQRSKEIVHERTSCGIAFYTSGQLFSEDYYTLIVIGKAGLGTPYMDGNTRL